jgi:predicted HTH domain antitoxin
MRVEIPQDILLRAEIDEEDVLLALAVQFYADNRVDYAEALALTGLDASQFNRELARRNISIHRYPVDCAA